VNARILVVDDEPDIRQLIAVSLRRAGYAIEQAEDGGTAVALALADPPDLLIVDVMMPGMTGHEVARVLAADPRTAAVPILMLSAKGQARDVDQGLASGAHAYVVKPFLPRELAARVGELLRK
jgi:DNA-binding response OmpR family regulator